jgi:hypothetical protein
MFKNDVAVAIKVDGKVLKEQGTTVRLPFNKEYAILVKNLHSTSAVVKVEIDGVDVLGGRQLVVPANRSVDLERYIEDNFDEGHRFKFARMTDKVAAHRGRKAEDGLVRVSWQFETALSVSLPITWIVNQPYPVYYPIYIEPKPWPKPQPWIWYGTSTTSYNADNVTWTSTHGSHGELSRKGVPTINTAAYFNQVSEGQETLCSCNVEAKGFTVKGSKSDQDFRTVATGELEPQEYSLTLQLVGDVGGRPVQVAVTKKTKITCEVCGTVNVAMAQFCNGCGNALD